MTEVRSYYGRNIVKEPVWTWEIPTYFFTGGVSGASGRNTAQVVLADARRRGR